MEVGGPLLHILTIPLVPAEGSVPKTSREVQAMRHRVVIQLSTVLVPTHSKQSTDTKLRRELFDLLHTFDKFMKDVT